MPPDRASFPRQERGESRDHPRPSTARAGTPRADIERGMVASPPDHGFSDALGWLRLLPGQAEALLAGLRRGFLAVDDGGERMRAGAEAVHDLGSALALAIRDLRFRGGDARQAVLLEVSREQAACARQWTGRLLRDDPDRGGEADSGNPGAGGEHTLLREAHSVLEDMLAAMDRRAGRRAPAPPRLPGGGLGCI